jgi:polar amino acid transport system substrate-binding protein
LEDFQTVKSRKGGQFAMKPNKQILSLLIVVYLIFCPALLTADILDDVTKRGVVKVGILPDAKPYGWQDAKGKFQGLDVDIAHELAKALDVKLEMVAVGAAARIAVLVSRKVDVNITGMTRTLERAKAVDFSDAYALVGAMMITHPESGITDYKKLNEKGRKVGTVMGGTGEIVIRKFFPDAEMVLYKSIADSYEACRTKKVDAISADSVEALKREQEEPKYFKVISPMLSKEYICMAIPKGEQNWLNWLNWFVWDMQMSGKIAELYEKWFETPPSKMGPTW